MRAKAAAAGFSDFINATSNISARFIVSPTFKVELEFLPPAPAKSICCRVMSSDIFKRASAVITPVINLVMDAIGIDVLVFLLYSTSPVLASITNAARAFTEGCELYELVSKICTALLLLEAATEFEGRIVVVNVVEPCGETSSPSSSIESSFNN